MDEELAITTEDIIAANAYGLTDDTTIGKFVTDLSTMVEAYAENYFGGDKELAEQYISAGMAQYGGEAYNQ